MTMTPILLDIYFRREILLHHDNFVMDLNKMAYLSMLDIKLRLYMLTLFENTLLM